MTITKLIAELQQASAGLPEDAEVAFKCITAKAAAQEFATVNSITGHGAVAVVYPDPGTATPAHVVVEFA